MNKLLVTAVVSLFGAISGVFVGTQYIEAQKPVTTFTGLVVTSDAEPIVLHIELSKHVGVEYLQGGEDNTAWKLQPAAIQ